jgi:hypothetical protein
MEAEITFDLVMDDDMGFGEGCYRLPDGRCQVFILVRRPEENKVEVRKDLTWQSGVTGLNVFLPAAAALSKSLVLAVLSEVLEVSAWSEVRGPDSIMRR